MSIDDVANKYTVAKNYVVDEVDHSGFVSWDESYSVGIEAIDRDHKHLLRLINNTRAASQYQTGEGFEHTAQIELIEYTKNHFAREEELMRKYGFPGYEDHKRIHDEMAINAKIMVKNYERDRLGSMEMISRFLGGWLIHHINGTDKQYSEFLISKGVC